jgi:hypothetical protein
MASKNTLAIGVLVFIVGLIIYSFSPMGPLYVAGSEHATTHYLGGFLAIIVGIIGVSLHRNIGKAETGVSILSIILGIVFILEVPGLLYSELQPHALAIEVVGALTVLVGLVGIGVALMTRKTTVMPKT